MHIIAKTSLTIDGFDGIYYASKTTSNKAIIVLLGDKADDILNKGAVKYLSNYANVFSLALKQDAHDNGVSNFKLEYIEKAINYLKTQGNQKIGIFGVSMQATIALVAATYFNDLSLVISISGCDYIPWGFKQGKLDKYKHAEWPSYTSLLTYKNQELDYHHINLSKHEYYQMYLDAKAKYHEMHSKTIFDYAEQVNPIDKNSFIKLEKAQAELVLVASKDDSMWDSYKYAMRLNERLKASNYTYPIHLLTYDYGTHLIFPQRMMKAIVPIFYNLVTNIYQSGKKHKQECLASRLALDKELSEVIHKW